MHLLQGIMDAHRRRSSVRVRGHHSHHTTPSRIQPSSNNPQNDVLARKYPRNPRYCTPRTQPRTSRAGIRLHNTHRRGAALLHQLGDLANGGLRADGGRLGARVHDGGQIGKGSFLAQLLGPGEHGGGLGVRAHGTELGLDASHGSEELLGRGGASLDFAEGFVEDFGDIEQADYVAVFVADGLSSIEELDGHGRDVESAYEMPEMLGDHEFERLGRAG